MNFFETKNITHPDNKNCRDVLVRHGKLNSNNLKKL